MLRDVDATMTPDERQALDLTMELYRLWKKLKDMDIDQNMKDGECLTA